MPTLQCSGRFSAAQLAALREFLAATYLPPTTHTTRQPAADANGQARNATTAAVVAALTTPCVVTVPFAADVMGTVRAEERMTLLTPADIHSEAAYVTARRIRDAADDGRTKRGMGPSTSLNGTTAPVVSRRDRRESARAPEAIVHVSAASLLASHMSLVSSTAAASGPLSMTPRAVIGT